MQQTDNFNQIILPQAISIKLQIIFFTTLFEIFFKLAQKYSPNKTTKTDKRNPNPLFTRFANLIRRHITPVPGPSLILTASYNNFMSTPEWNDRN